MGCGLEGKDMTSHHMEPCLALLSGRWQSMGRFPLGCSVHRYAHTSHGIDECAEVRIQLSDMKYAPQVVTEFVGQVTRGTTKSPLLFSDVVERVRGKSKTAHPEIKIADALLEAEWIGAVHIDNRTEPHTAWHVRRMEP